MSDILGVIGGSGLYQMEEMKNVRNVRVRTPFGDPSDTLVVGEIEGRTVAFLPRHGKGHRIPPSQINFRANLYALKKIGAKWVLSISAVGSMKEGIRPGDIVVVDQFYDHTRFRPNTFFSDGVVGHIPFANPVCPVLREIVSRSARKVVRRVHRGGTYLCMEGPAFSTRAESRIYRKWGVDVIGMTNMPEAKLAREAELCYATLALATDYDCWHESEEEVSIEAILAIIRRNVKNSKRIIREVAKRLPGKGGCGCGETLRHAIITDRKKIPAAARKRLSLLIGRYL
ncbi:MAG TPA: S-methyl-5'-thioadenosine phosphorylase [Candidatus Deferrimicrobiaceae bacterium]|nr:S-methyl-5'-thioadenosine phosphorylase [Candidatus Deferrimicrobiaceae bacterium]